jgi:hypothetical protein
MAGRVRQAVWNAADAGFARGVSADRRGDKGEDGVVNSTTKMSPHLRFPLAITYNREGLLNSEIKEVRA